MKSIFIAFLLSMFLFNGGSDIKTYEEGPLKFTYPQTAKLKIVDTLSGDRKVGASILIEFSEDSFMVVEAYHEIMDKNIFTKKRAESLFEQISMSFHKMGGDYTPEFQNIELLSSATDETKIYYMLNYSIDGYPFYISSKLYKGNGINIVLTSNSFIPSDAEYTKWEENMEYELLQCIKRMGK